MKYCILGGATRSSYTEHIRGRLDASLLDGAGLIAEHVIRGLVSLALAHAETEGPSFRVALNFFARILHRTFLLHTTLRVTSGTGTTQTSAT